MIKISLIFLFFSPSFLTISEFIFFNNIPGYFFSGFAVFFYSFQSNIHLWYFSSANLCGILISCMGDFVGFLKQRLYSFILKLFS